MNMSYWIRVVGALVFCAVYLSAAVTVTQPPSMSTSTGQNIQIPCTISGTSSGANYVSWYQQIPGKTPKYLFGHTTGGSIYKGTDIPDRFSISVSGSSVTFAISSVQSVDAADYYCAKWDSGLHFGKGTRLGIGDPRAPIVTVLPPSADEVTSKGTATLVCLVNGFNPGSVAVEWSVDGSAKNSDVDTSPIQQDKDNTFSLSSYLTLTASDWNLHDLYSCVVKHQAQANPLKTTIERSSCI
ncbi:immunoglobulin lambda-1 light chain-like [Leucoraja erinacea]|uniref:immunoglobulin lambda-1 light chain-like n=1 Tax=Leucoraja erinaceus TaxID=7782 RepID=UPI002457BF35|nr:immunoglobulin lambda-1 light chain-like [Leucoraja erinacea]